MNEPKYVSLPADAYLFKRRAWIRQMEAEVRRNERNGLTPYEVMWILLGIWLTFLVLVLWGCAAPSSAGKLIECRDDRGWLYTGPFVGMEDGAYVVHVDDMTRVQYPTQYCVRLALSNNQGGL